MPCTLSTFSFLSVVNKTVVKNPSYSFNVSLISSELDFYIIYSYVPNVEFIVGLLTLHSHMTP